jgi:hypothetical protein
MTWPTFAITAEQTDVLAESDLNLSAAAATGAEPMPNDLRDMITRVAERKAAVVSCPPLRESAMFSDLVWALTARAPDFCVRTQCDPAHCAPTSLETVCWLQSNVTTQEAHTALEEWDRLRDAWAIDIYPVNQGAALLDLPGTGITDLGGAEEARETIEWAFTYNRHPREFLQALWIYSGVIFVWTKVDDRPAALHLLRQVAG